MWNINIYLLLALALVIVRPALIGENQIPQEQLADMINNDPAYQLLYAEANQKFMALYQEPLGEVLQAFYRIVGGVMYRVIYQTALGHVQVSAYQVYWERSVTEINFRFLPSDNISSQKIVSHAAMVIQSDNSSSSSSSVLDFSANNTADSLRFALDDPTDELNETQTAEDSPESLELILNDSSPSNQTDKVSNSTLTPQTRLLEQKSEPSTQQNLKEQEVQANKIMSESQSDDEIKQHLEQISSSTEYGSHKEDRNAARMGQFSQ